MIVSVTDIGSNTVKMKTYSVKGGRAEETASTVNNAKLISYIKDGVLSEEGIFLLCSILSSFKEEAKKNRSDVFACFATASLRRTSNIDAIRSAVRSFCGIEIDLVSGDDEAFYSFAGVKHTLSPFPDDAILLDMGGGSTEIVKCVMGEKESSESMGFGSLSLALDFEEGDYPSVSQHAVNSLEKTSVYPVTSENAILVGGTALAIATLYSHFYPDEPARQMTVNKLQAVFNRLTQSKEAAQDLLQRLTPHRVTTVLPGLAAFLAIFEKCSVENVTVSTCGIREGYVYEKILRSNEEYNK